MREIQNYINTSKEAQSKRWYFLLAQLDQMPEKLNILIIKIPETATLSRWVFYVFTSVPHVYVKKNANTIFHSFYSYLQQTVVDLNS